MLPGADTSVRLEELRALFESAHVRKNLTAQLDEAILSEHAAVGFRSLLESVTRVVDANPSAAALFR